LSRAVQAQIINSNNLQLASGQQPFDFAIHALPPAVVRLVLAPHSEGTTFSEAHWVGETARFGETLAKFFGTTAPPPSKNFEAIGVATATAAGSSPVMIHITGTEHQYLMR